MRNTVLFRETPFERHIGYGNVLGTQGNTENSSPRPTFVREAYIFVCHLTRHQPRGRSERKRDRKLARRSRWKLLRRASKQDCPSSIVLPLLYSAAAASIRTCVHAWTGASELIRRLRAAYVRRCTHTAYCAIPRRWRVCSEKRNRKTGAGRSGPQRRERRIGPRLITDFRTLRHVVSHRRGRVRARQFFSFLGKRRSDRR